MKSDIYKYILKSKQIKITYKLRIYNFINIYEISVCFHVKEK